MTDLPQSAYDKEGDDDVLLQGKRSPRPKDAATLILVRRDARDPRVLMGKRSGGHEFMPDKYVFPGGRVDPQDGRARSLSELSPNVEGQLRKQARRQPRAFALTAVRETFEETGLIVGKQGEVAGRPPAGWDDYYGLGVAPCLKDMQFFGRAVTPPYRPKRFDARFFMGFAEDMLIDDRPPQDGAELSDLQWVTFSDAKSLDLPGVTRFMIDEIAARLEAPDTARGAAYLRWSRGGHAIDRL